MAINLKDIYAYFMAASADYPGGSFKNASTGVSADGTPFEQRWANDFLGFFQAILLKAGVVPSGTPDTARASQYLQALQSLMWTPGDYKWCAYSTPGDGWLECNGGTIGNADSAATARANADTLALFTKLWAEPAASYPLLTNVGVPVGRGASAAADFAAGRQLTLPDMRGMTPRGWDHARGVDVGRVIGSYQGDQLLSHVHALPGMENGDNLYPITGPEAGGGGFLYNYDTSAVGGTENTVKNIAGMFVIRY